MTPTAATKQNWLQALATLWLITLTLSIWGCGSTVQKRPLDSSAGAACQTIPHRSGATQVCGQPQRIVALDPHALDLLLALDVQPIGYAEDKRALVGSPTSGQPTVQIKYLGDRLTQRPIHVGTWQTPSLETILKLKPDLILGRIEPTLYASLAKIAPTLPLASSDQERWQESLLKLGKAMQREGLAQQAIAQYQQRIAIARNDLKSVTQTSRVLLLSVSALNRIQIFTDDSYAGGLLKELGFQLVVPNQLPVQSSEIDISLETLPQLQADTIIVMASGNSRVENIEKDWNNNPVLRSLSASQSQRVYFVDYQLWSRIEGPTAAELILNQVRLLMSKIGK